MVKKIILFVSIFSLMVLFSSCSDEKQADITVNELETIYYTLIDENNFITSYKYDFLANKEFLIDEKGYCDFQYVTAFNNYTYYFCSKNETMYIACTNENKTELLPLPTHIKTVYDIQCYNNKPLFMSTENGGRCAFYEADFDNKKISVVFETEEIPAKYLAFNNHLILCMNSIDVELFETGNQTNYGEIYVLMNQKLIRIDDGVEPVPYSEDSFLYTKINNDIWETYQYNFLDNQRHRTQISYMDSTIYDLNLFEPKIQLVNKKYAVFAIKDNHKDRLICRNIETGESSIIKSFEGNSLCSFSLEN